jgi:hypothetical protein
MPLLKKCIKGYNKPSLFFQRVHNEHYLPIVPALNQREGRRYQPEPLRLYLFQTDRFCP